MDPRSLDEQLRFAISHRRLLQVGYKGAFRVVEPHDYGIQKGKTRLLTFQLHRSGGSPRKSVEGWRLLDVSEIERCVVLDDTFHGSRGTSHQHHYQWDVLHARVS